MRVFIATPNTSCFQDLLTVALGRLLSAPSVSLSVRRDCRYCFIGQEFIDVLFVGRFLSASQASECSIVQRAALEVSSSATENGCWHLFQNPLWGAVCLASMWGVCIPHQSEGSNPGKSTSDPASSQSILGGGSRWPEHLSSYHAGCWLQPDLLLAVTGIGERRRCNLSHPSLCICRTKV